MTHAAGSSRPRLAVALLALALGLLCAPRALSFQEPPGGGGPGPDAPKPDYTRPFKTSEVARRAVITERPEPDFTEKARRSGVEGIVSLRMVLHYTGSVTDISVVKGLPDGLTEQSVAAARKIKFRPAVRDGREVSQYVVVEYAFVTRANSRDVDEPPVILSKPQPEYTEEARRKGTRGKVVLRVTLTSFGVVMVDSVESGLPHGLTERAVEAAGRIRYKPATLGKRPVSLSFNVEYVFNP